MSVIDKRRANNMVSVGDKKAGTPADALCKPGQYDAFTENGKKYDAKNGPDRWDASMRGKKSGY